MLETSARLLRLLSLLQARRDWTSTDLAIRLGVTTRTIRNDVARLRGLGYPVEARPGVAGGYRLGAGGALPPLLLDDEEAVAVAVGLRTAAGGSVAGIEEASVRALAKLQQVLPSRLRRRVSAFQSYALPVPSPGPRVDPEVLTVIAGACRDHERLRFDYRAHSGAVSRRSVEPYRRAHRRAPSRWHPAMNAPPFVTVTRRSCATNA
jgi:predicted DNA-binding transcriptional regulator YafY